VNHAVLPRVKAASGSPAWRHRFSTRHKSGDLRSHMAHEPPRAARPGRLRAAWNRLRHTFGSTRDKDRRGYAPLLEAGTYPGSERSNTPRSSYSDAASEASRRPGNAQPAGLHVPPGGPFHTHHWSRPGGPLDTHHGSRPHVAPDGTPSPPERTGASPPAAEVRHPTESYKGFGWYPQSGIAAGAQTATIRPSPPHRHREQLAGPSSQQRAATPGRSARPPALGG